MNTDRITIKSLGHFGYSLSLPKPGGVSHLLINPLIDGSPEMAQNVDTLLGDVAYEYILLSHWNEALWENVKDIATAHRATVIADRALTNWIRNQGLEIETIPMNPDEEISLSWGELVMTAAQGDFTPPGASEPIPGCGFIFRNLGNLVYYAGQTALNPELRTIGHLHKPNVSFLPVGQGYFQAQELARATMWLGSDILIPIVPLNDVSVDLDEVYSTVDTYTPAICRILAPGESYDLVQVESSGRQSGPESRY